MIANRRPKGTLFDTAGSFEPIVARTTASTG
jgi:hypothetical protein